MSKLKNFLQFSMQAIFTLTLSAMLFLCLFLGDWDYFAKKKFTYSNIIYLSAGLLLAVLLFFIIYFLTKKSWFCRYCSRIIAAASVLLGIFILIASYHYYFKTGWDPWVLIRNAYKIAHDEMETFEHWYYSIYPNNVLLTYLFSLLIKYSSMLGIDNYYYVLICFQCVLCAVGAYLTYRTMDMISDSKLLAVWAWLVYVILVGLSPWVVVPYSDSIGVFLVVLCMYLYMRIRQGKYRKSCLFLLALSLYLGYKIKPQILIIGVAMIIVLVVDAIGRKIKSWNGLASNIAPAVCGWLAALLLMQAVITVSGIEMFELNAFGITHYLMMGLNEETNGGYYNDDVLFSQASYGQEARDIANIDVIKHRLVAYGVAGLIPFWCKKMLTVYNDGTFAWTGEGEFFYETYDKGNPAVQRLFKSYYYPEGERYQHYLNLSQAFWMAILFLGICASFGGRKKSVQVLMLAVVGLTMFELLFEARARYLFAYVPVYIMLGAVGLDKLGGGVKRLVARCTRSNELQLKK